jgi:hypothetical protein
MRGYFPHSLLAAASVFLVVGAVPADASPTLEWQHLYDGGSQQADLGVKALADAAGNLVVAGEVTDAAGNGNVLIRKLARASGDSLWSHSVPGTVDNPMAVGGMTWDGAGDLLIGVTRLGCYG